MPCVDELCQACFSTFTITSLQLSKVPQFDDRAGVIEAAMPSDQVFVFISFAPYITGGSKVRVNFDLYDRLERFLPYIEHSQVEILTCFNDQVWIVREPFDLSDYISCDLPLTN